MSKNASSGSELSNPLTWMMGAVVAMGAFAAYRMLKADGSNPMSTGQDALPPSPPPGTIATTGGSVAVPDPATGKVPHITFVAVHKGMFYAGKLTLAGATLPTSNATDDVVEAYLNGLGFSGTTLLTDSHLSAAMKKELPSALTSAPLPGDRIFVTSWGKDDGFFQAPATLSGFYEQKGTSFSPLTVAGEEDNQDNYL